MKNAARRAPAPKNIHMQQERFSDTRMVSDYISVFS